MKRVARIVLALMIVAAMSISAFADVSGSQAKKIALKNAKHSAKRVKNVRVSYDREDGLYEVKFKSKKNGARYDYEIVAANGKIAEKTVNYKYKKTRSRKKIGKTKAMKKAAKKAGVKLSVVKAGKCKYDYDDGKGVYEIEFWKGNKKYEVEILAAKGKVIEYKWEIPALKNEAKRSSGDDEEDDD